MNEVLLLFPLQSCWTSWQDPILEVLSFEQNLISLPSVYGLTHWLTGSSARIMLLETRFQAPSTLIKPTWEFSLLEYLANNNSKSNTINLSTVPSCGNLVRISSDENIFFLQSRSLAEAKLEQFCYCLTFHPQVK